MPWPVDPDIRIDRYAIKQALHIMILTTCLFRFDGRSLLDYIPGPYTKQDFATKEDKDIQDELNFERYHDLVEMERLQGIAWPNARFRILWADVTCSGREATSHWSGNWVDQVTGSTQGIVGYAKQQWQVNVTIKSCYYLTLIHLCRPKSQTFHTFDYGTNDSNDNMDHEQESQLLKDILFPWSTIQHIIISNLEYQSPWLQCLQADILQYVDDLTDKDRRILNDMAEKYGIQNYGRLLRMAKKDRDDDLRELQAKQVQLENWNGW